MSPIETIMALLGDLETTLEFQDFTNPLADEFALNIERQHAQCCQMKAAVSLGRCILPTVTLIRFRVELSDTKGRVAVVKGCHPYVTGSGQSDARHEADAIKEAIRFSMRELSNISKQ